MLASVLCLEKPAQDTVHSIEGLMGLWRLSWRETAVMPVIPGGSAKEMQGDTQPGVEGQEDFPGEREFL